VLNQIPENHVESHELLVTESMTVDFATDIPRLGKLHAVCSTYTLAKHIELVSRKLILPYLNETEEAIGFELCVKHIAPAAIGSQLVFTASFKHYEKDRIYCNVEVFAAEQLIATGSTTQVVKHKDALEKLLDAP